MRVFLRKCFLSKFQLMSWFIVHWLPKASVPFNTKHPMKAHKQTDIALNCHRIILLIRNYELLIRNYGLLIRNYELLIRNY